MNINLMDYIHQSNLIEGFDSVLADEQSLRAWEWLIQQPELNHHVITELQRRIVQHQEALPDEWRGNYRDRIRQEVWIGERTGAPSHLVRYSMVNWLLDYKRLTPRKAHIMFERIHPFMDGNGRTGRMLMWYQQIELGKKPLLIKKSGVEAYYNWFKEKIYE